MLIWFSFCSSLSSWGTNLVAIWCIFRLSFKIFLNWPIWNSQHIRNFADKVYSVFKDTFLHMIHAFICCACWWMSLASDIFNRCHSAFGLGRPIKNCVLPFHCLLSKMYTEHFNCSMAFLNQFREKIWWTLAVLPSLLFSRYAKIANGETHAYI